MKSYFATPVPVLVASCVLGLITIEPATSGHAQVGLERKRDSLAVIRVAKEILDISPDSGGKVPIKVAQYLESSCGVLVQLLYDPPPDVIVAGGGGIVFVGKSTTACVLRRYQ